MGGEGRLGWKENLHAVGSRAYFSACENCPTFFVVLVWIVHLRRVAAGEGPKKMFAVLGLSFSSRGEV